MSTLLYVAKYFLYVSTKMPLIIIKWTMESEILGEIVWSNVQFSF